MKVELLKEKNYEEVARIYSEGISTGFATFETFAPSWTQFNEKFLKVCRYVLVDQDRILAWCALSAVSKRAVYSGVAEDTIYVDPRYQGKGLGQLLLAHLINESEHNGFWSLQAGIFPDNIASIKLHENCGFRIVGIREKIAQREGKWYDNVIMERRSIIVGTPNKEK